MGVFTLAGVPVVLLPWDRHTPAFQLCQTGVSASPAATWCRPTETSVGFPPRVLWGGLQFSLISIIPPSPPEDGLRPKICEYPLHFTSNRLYLLQVFKSPPASNRLCLVKFSSLLQVSFSILLAYGLRSVKQVLKSAFLRKKHMLLAKNFPRIPIHMSFFSFCDA